MTVIHPGRGGFLDDTIGAVRAYDAARPRSTQAALGWSEVGGCRSYAAFRIAGEWASDEPDSWGAQRGTAIHEYLQAILGATMRVEVVTGYRGIPGHADLVVDGTHVTDIKSTRLANSLLWQRDESVLWEKRVQAQGYAASLADDGKLPDDAIVRLLVVPADGTFADWWAWEEPFDRSIADWGVERVAEVRALMAAGERLPRDKPYAWCLSWCPFFTICREPGEASADEEITDPEAAAAIAAYGEANAQIRDLIKVKDSLAPMIRTLRGTAGEWRVSQSKPGEKKTVLDEDWIRADYAARGEPVPERLVPGAAPRLNVTRIRKQARS